MNKIEVLYPHNYRDVVAMLRNAADRIESGDYAGVEEAALVLKMGDTVEVFGWGKSTLQSSLGLLQLGIAYLCQCWNNIREHRR
jgi:hypothetical protein